MRCEEVQGLLPDYADNQLPEVTQRRVDHHLATCHSCRSEYTIWTEGGNWIQADKEQYTSVITARSIVDAVMNRILSEEKWAIPIGKKIFTLTARMRRIGASAAMVLLMLCAFTLYSNANGGESGTLLADGEVLAMTATAKSQVISSSIQDTDGTYVVLSEPLPADGKSIINTPSSVLPLDNDSDPSKPKYSLILSFFGILITVLVLSWMTRA